MIGLVLGVLGAVLLLLLAAPRTAEAFWENEVIESTATGGSKLTPEAETLFKRPTFLSEEPSVGSVAATAGDVGETYAVAEASGLAPAIGAFAAGFFVGEGIKAICNSFISGCLEFEHNAPQPKPEVEFGNWSYQKGKLELTSPEKGSITYVLQPFTYVWSVSGSPSTILRNPYKGKAEGGKTEKECYGYAWPHGFLPNGTFIQLTTGPCFESTVGYGSEINTESALGELRPGNGGSEATGSIYCPIGPLGAAGTCTSTPNSKWSEKAAEVLTNPSHNGFHQKPAERLGEHIAATIEGVGGSTRDPYHGYVKVPSCEGASKAECLLELEELDLKPKVTELDWEDAVIEELEEFERDPEKVREEEAEKVIEVRPPYPNEVSTGSEIVVVTNPDLEDMPEAVPPPGPGPDGDGEDQEEYERRLAPIFLPDVGTLGDGEIDPTKGPEKVSRTSPSSGTRLNPHVDHRVKVWQNPADAPVPASAGGWTPPAIPSIDMTPLSGFKPCGVFPFGLFCWVGEALGQFNTTGVCPHTSVPIGGGNHFDLSLCGESAETILGYLRPVLLFAFVVGCGFLFARGTKAIGDD